ARISSSVVFDCGNYPTCARAAGHQDCANPRNASKLAIRPAHVPQRTTMQQFPLVLIAVIIVLIWLFNSLNVLREYERGVIFRLGRLLAEPKGPGLDLGVLAN